MEENTKNIRKKALHPDSGFRDIRKPHATSLQNETQKEHKLHVRKSSGKSSSTHVQIQETLMNSNPLSDFHLTALPLTNKGFTNMCINSTQTDAEDDNSEKLLKPLSGCSAYCTEWKEFAEVISKVNLAQLRNLMVCSNSKVPVFVLHRILLI
jgi:hypothetical protein